MQQSDALGVAGPSSAQPADDDAPRREVHCADALEYLASVADLPCVVTSPPDITESEQLAQWGGVDGYKTWEHLRCATCGCSTPLSAPSPTSDPNTPSRRWLVDTCKQILLRLRPECAAVFYVTDAQVMSSVKGRTNMCKHYIDKSFLCSKAAEGDVHAPPTVPAGCRTGRDRAPRRLTTAALTWPCHRLLRRGRRGDAVAQDCPAEQGG